MDAESTKAPGAPYAQANGKTTSTLGEGRTSDAASYAKPGSSRSANQGEEKDTNICKD